MLLALTSLQSRRTLQACSWRRRRACLAAATCLCLLLLSVLALTSPWWGTWLLWRPSNTSFVTLGPGVDANTYAVVNASEWGQAVVPRIIHQTWKTEVIPERWAAARQSCIDLHPEWEFKLWTDDSARALIAERVPELMPTFDSYIFNIERADAIRYVLLYLYGGVYIDLDIECRKPLDFLRKYPFIMPQTRPVGFSNDFLIAKPGHPFLRQLVQALPQWNLWLLSKYSTVMFSTGPMFVTLQASLHKHRRALWVLPDELYGKYVPRPGSLFRHLFGSSWHGEDAKSMLWIVHHPVVLLVVCVASVMVGVLYGWRKCCLRSRASPGSTCAQQDAALKMC